MCTMKPPCFPGLKELIALSLAYDPPVGKEDYPRDLLHYSIDSQSSSIYDKSKNHPYYYKILAKH